MSKKSMSEVIAQTSQAVQRGPLDARRAADIHGFKQGDRVLAYGKYHGTVEKPLAFDAYSVLIDRPRRRKIKREDYQVVAASNLESLR